MDQDRISAEDAGLFDNVHPRQRAARPAEDESSNGVPPPNSHHLPRWERPRCVRCGNAAHQGPCWDPCAWCARRHRRGPCPPYRGTGGGNGFGSSSHPQYQTNLFLGDLGANIVQALQAHAPAIAAARAQARTGGFIFRSVNRGQHQFVIHGGNEANLVLQIQTAMEIARAPARPLLTAAPASVPALAVAETQGGNGEGGGRRRRRRGRGGRGRGGQNITRASPSDNLLGQGDGQSNQDAAM
ncbi:MAG: hypothetical protein Q9170_002261 [Blastenia crenularia]